MTKPHGLTFTAIKEEEESYRRSIRNGGIAKTGKTKQSKPEWWLHCSADQFVEWLEQQEAKRDRRQETD